MPTSRTPLQQAVHDLANAAQPLTIALEILAARHPAVANDLIDDHPLDALLARYHDASRRVRDEADRLARGSTDAVAAASASPPTSRAAGRGAGASEDAPAPSLLDVGRDHAAGLGLDFLRLVRRAVDFEERPVVAEAVVDYDPVMTPQIAEAVEDARAYLAGHPAPQGGPPVPATEFPPTKRGAR